jgi:hypothetical protein
MTEINNKKRHREESDFLHEKSGQNTTSTFPEIVVTLDKVKTLALIHSFLSRKSDFFHDKKYLFC